MSASEVAIVIGLSMSLVMLVIGLIIVKRRRALSKALLTLAVAPALYSSVAAQILKDGFTTMQLCIILIISIFIVVPQFAYVLASAPERSDIGR